MQEYIDEGTVMWALVHVMIGAGALRRSRKIFLHVDGRRCPETGLQSRAKINEYTNDAKRIMGAAGIPELRVRKRKEVTVDYVLDRVKKFIVEDKAEYTIDWIIKAHEQRLREKIEKLMKERASAGVSAAVRIPGHDSSATFEQGRDALKSVSTGPQNWL